MRLVERLNLDRGLLPIFVLTLSLMVFAAAGAIGGSGFLAVYLAGLVAGNSDIRGVSTLKRFQDGMSWLAQIIMFLVLGLFATPSQFPAILVPALLLGLFLIFVARPVAVWLCLIPFKLPRQEIAFISWVGLRGAVSILLAITPLLGGLENGRAIFNIAFIIVLVSLVVQGWTVGPLARRLGLIVPHALGPLDKVELELPGSAHHELLAYRVVPGSPVARATASRAGRGRRWSCATAARCASRTWAGSPPAITSTSSCPTAIRACSTGCSPAAPRSTPRTRTSSAPSPSTEAIRLPSSQATYGATLKEAEHKLTIGDLIKQRLRRPCRICRPRRARADRPDRPRCRRKGPHRRRRPVDRARAAAAGSRLPQLRRTPQPDFRLLVPARARPRPRRRRRRPLARLARGRVRQSSPGLDR